ncbi:glycosyltransferase [Knoellia flava]|nr:glycosyltransferase [Knoellia flava]
MTAHVFCREMLRQLGRRVEPVLVVSSEGPELKELESAGVEAVSVSMPRDPSPLLDTIALVHWVVLLLKRRPLLVVALTPKASLLALLAAKVTRVPHRTYLLVGLRLDGEVGIKRKLLTVLERLTSACATDVIANSPSLHHRYLELRLTSESKLSHTDPGSDHGVDTRHFMPQPRAAGASSPPIGVVNIGFVGRVTADKGIGALADALGRPSLAGTYHLTVVGSHDEPDSEEMLAALRGANVNFTAHGPVDDIRPHMSQMDFLVLPTRREGFPNVVLEASAMGVPTLTTKAVGAIDSVIHERTGLLVPVDDVDALETALTRMITSADDRRLMGTAARAYVEENFDPSRIVSQILERALPDRRVSGADNPEREMSAIRESSAGARKRPS